MAKEAYYFSHDFGARNDPKLQKVLMKLGQEGKGVYWDLVEMLFEEGGKLLVSECESYAFALRTKEECISSLLKDFGLFVDDGEFFWSNSVLRRISDRDEKSEKARLSANSRWNNTNALKSDANALRSESDGNAIKERKGKEIEKKGKIKGNKLPLSDKELFFLKIFTEITNRGFKTLDEKSRKQLAAILENGYTSKDFKKAIGFALVEMTERNRQNYLTPEFITRETEFLKYVTMVQIDKSDKKEEAYVFPVSPVNHQIFAKKP